MDLTGQRVIVLGGGGGIGRQSVHALTQLGAAVAIIDIDRSAADRVAEESGATALVGNVTGLAELTQLFEDASVAMGGPATGVVDVIGAAKIAPYATLTPQDWEAQLDVNLRHAINVCAIAHTMATPPASIAMVGSVSGVRYLDGQGAYGVVKAALHMLVVTEAVEFAAQGTTRINAIAPGWTRTPRLNERLPEDTWKRVGSTIPRGYAGDPSEIAGPLAFLISPLSSYVTGEVILAGGGLSNTVPLPPAVF